jgi:murein DD-endopeptidase MepM/ murein hydrolase activator NlpD
MSNNALEQHVRRRRRVKPLPRPADFREFNKGGPSIQWLPGDFLDGSHQKTPKWASKNTPPGIVQRVTRRPGHVSKPVKAKKKQKAQGGKISSRSVFTPPLTFLFGKEGLFPLPSRNGASLPLFPIIAAVLTLVISVAALNWNFPALRFPAAPAMGDYLSGQTDEIGPDLASYAGLYSLGSQGSLGSQAGPESGEEIPLDLMETFGWKEYKVRKGDTLSEIARAQELSLGTLIACNSITNARRLREGEVLRIPNMDGIPYTVKAGDSLSAISVSSGVPLTVILDVNDLQSDLINPGASLFLPGVSMPQDEIRLALGESFIYPIRGTLSSSYGWRIDPIAKVERFHSAIDLAAPLGTPVRAAMDGKVSRVAVNSVYGIYVIITHPGAYQSLYAHLSAASVKQGATVTQGSKIGEVGSTGYSTGPHLHFGVFRNNKAINPLEVLQR